MSQVQFRIILLAALVSSTAAFAQQLTAPANPLDVVPDKMPFDVPYGAPISIERARQVIAAATAEAAKRGWKQSIAVSDSGANLIAFEKMDGSMLGSIDIAIHKSRTAAKFRRDIKIFENAVQSGVNGILSLDDVIVNRGGIPLIENGAVVGAIGVSGGSGSQDEVVAKAGVAVVNK